MIPGPLAAQRVERIGDATLYLGDCREVMPTLPRPAAIITDPPYGLGDRMQGGTWAAKPAFVGMPQWDQKPPTADLLQYLIERAEKCVLWGGQYFRLPPARCWLLWDKVNAVPTMADFEMAWTSLDRPSKRWIGPVGRSLHGHPTEKPLPLMSWCIDQARIAPGGTILDPYVGSGTTGVASVRAGHPFIGVEIDPNYFDIACRRIEAEVRAPRLPLIAPEPALQEAML